MKRLTLTLTILLISARLFGQQEFETYENGLIYSEKTMNKLSNIVDSLNLKYKTCDINKVFHSKSQTIGHIVQLDKENIQEAKKDMEENIPFNVFIEKYPNAKVEKNVLVVKYKYDNYYGEQIVEFSEIDFTSYYGLEIQKTNENELYDKAVKNTWVYSYNEPSKYTSESLRAFYFPGEFEAKPLPLKYSRQIGYSDCLIDTMTTKFKDNAESGWVELPKNWQNLSLKKQRKLLEEMRSTKVIGGCSMDSRPREHAIHIALLSAETTNWEVFLKSHLDIMNDRFDRMSDGSYAWAARQTYIKELEELDINVLDLLIGISLRVEDPSENHYYGSIGRLGRAISESANKEAFENQMLLMIQDSELDYYNRVLSYLLYVNYTHYLESESEKKENIDQLQQAIQSLPDHLRRRIKLNQE